MSEPVRRPPRSVVDMMGVPVEALDQWNVFHPEWLEDLQARKAESTAPAAFSSFGGATPTAVTVVVVQARF